MRLINVVPNNVLYAGVLQKLKSRNLHTLRLLSQQAKALVNKFYTASQIRSMVLFNRRQVLVHKHEINKKMVDDLFKHNVRKVKYTVNLVNLNNFNNRFRSYACIEDERSYQRPDYFKITIHHLTRSRHASHYKTELDPSSNKYVVKPSMRSGKKPSTAEMLLLTNALKNQDWNRVWDGRDKDGLDKYTLWGSGLKIPAINTRTAGRYIHGKWR